MAARSLASLTLSFGLVNVAVKLYSATESSATIRFNMLAKDGSRGPTIRIQGPYMTASGNSLRLMDLRGRLLYPVSDLFEGFGFPGGSGIRIVVLNHRSRVGMRRCNDKKRNLVARGLAQPFERGRSKCAAKVHRHQGDPLLARFEHKYACIKGIEGAGGGSLAIAVTP